MESEFSGNQHECRFYTAGSVNKMAVSVTGPRAVNELGGPVIPGSGQWDLSHVFCSQLDLYIVVCDSSSILGI